MTIQETMSWIESFSHSGAPITDLSRIAALMQALGNPHEKLRFIHIAGTNGKGSVAEYCTNVLTDCGYRTGTLTSPFIRHYRDRIRQCGEDIPEDALCAAAGEVASVTDSESYSQFEITMAIAFLYFIREKVDIVVLETGIGGLVDSTNIIPPPILSIITSVSMDHMQLLGTTIEEIAVQKAGILKKGSEAVFSADSKPDALRILTKTAAKQNCPFVIPDYQDCRIEQCSLTGNRFSYQGNSYTTQMGGQHQIQNALTVLEAVEILGRKGFALPQEKVAAALARTSVPARIQILQEDPLIVLDGGHNADGVGALVRLLDASGVDQWIGICGMVGTKDQDSAAFQLALALQQVICVDGFSVRALPKEQLAAAFQREHLQAVTMELQEALPHAIAMAKASNSAIVICGSLYLANYFLDRGEGSCS